ncbi:MAG: hypothetical protein UY21_C0007G0018 [Microgenomates group bacterium GW2011_GWA1_48_10]|nr:MAG: hypothetical protein UY21_C0007G0018 [Microgenomates group bacterium GW2011_GWA1_48_10]
MKRPKLYAFLRVVMPVSEKIRIAQLAKGRGRSVSELCEGWLLEKMRMEAVPD